MSTEKDSAARLGVTPPLVVRVLTGSADHTGASGEMVRRIREPAAEVSHRSSAAAPTPRAERTKTLGVIVKDFTDPFFWHMVGELRRLGWARQYSLVVTGYDSGSDEPLDLASLQEYGLDGLIILGSDFEPAGLEALTARGIRTVQIGIGPRPKGVCGVVMDQEYGLRQLIGHLRKLGHRDFGFIGDDSPSSVRREQIVFKLLKNYGMVPRPNALVRVTVHGTKTGYDAMLRLLRPCSESLPTAVIAADDLIAQGALRALFEWRIAVPKDLSIVGVDDIPSAEMTVPALTTLRQPIAQMIWKAFGTLTETRRKFSTLPDEIAVRPKLILRESCASPRHAGWQAGS